MLMTGNVQDCQYDLALIGEGKVYLEHQALTVHNETSSDVLNERVCIKHNVKFRSVDNNGGFRSRI